MIVLIASDCPFTSSVQRRRVKLYAISSLRRRYVCAGDSACKGDAHRVAAMIVLGARGAAIAAIALITALLGLAGVFHVALDDATHASMAATAVSMRCERAMSEHVRKNSSVRIAVEVNDAAFIVVRIVGLPGELAARTQRLQYEYSRDRFGRPACRAGPDCRRADPHRRALRLRLGRVRAGRPLRRPC